MQDLLLEQLQARKNRKNYALVTIVDSFGSTPRTSGKMLVYEGGLSKGTVGGGPHEQMAKQDAVQCIRSGCNALKRYEIKSDGEVCTGGISVFIEVFRVAPLLVVCGGGHVGRNLIPMAKMVGFDVLLVDTRAPEIISEAVSLADRFERVSDFRSGLCALAIEPEAYYVLCAYSHAADSAALQAVLGLCRHGRQPHQDRQHFLPAPPKGLYQCAAFSGPYPHRPGPGRRDPGGDRRGHYGADHCHTAWKAKINLKHIFFAGPLVF